MWSRFEKLKDNITQIASDVLDSQDDDEEELDKGALDDEELDGEYNVPQSLYLRDRDSDGEDESAGSLPTEEKRNGHVDVVREEFEQEDALVEKTDTESEKIVDNHYIATNGFDSHEKVKHEVSLLNGKAINGGHDSEPLLGEVEVKESELTVNEQGSHEGSSHKGSPHEDSPEGSPHKVPLEGSPHKVPLEGSPHKVPLEGSPHKVPLEGSPHKVPLEGSPHKVPLEGSPHKVSLEGSPLKGSPEGSPHEGSPEVFTHYDLPQGYFHKDSHEDLSHKESQTSEEGSSDRELQTSHESSSYRDSQAVRALDEQVRSLSERLRASEDVCCSLQTKLDSVSTERDTISKKLEDALLEPEKLSKEVEEVSLERDSLLKKVEEVSFERDKAVQNLGRLRQNLMDMDSSTSEKMENDTILIGDLKTRLKTAEELVSQLQQALAKSQDDLAEANRKNALQSIGTNEELEVLRQRLKACTDALESKDVELANLQSALGQYYAEIDAQDRLESEHRAVRELNARLTRDLKIAEETMELKAKELETATSKLASADALNLELKQTMHKLQQDVLKLRAALEQSITSLNRMSSDSDFYVDRRIVIKLLVTYFQRHHSREVLDLMVRMLGFTEEDKRRVGVAQQNARGGGMVRSVFGVPGRIVGGILGSSDPGTSPPATPGENQSFADSWIDFLLKESQERERRERGEAPMSPMANLTRSMPSSPSGGSYHKPSSSFSGFPSSFLLPPKPSRVSSSTDLETILNGETRDDASSS